MVARLAMKAMSFMRPLHSGQASTASRALETSMLWICGGPPGFSSAPATRASVLPAPEDAPISRMVRTPGVAATRRSAR
jgi:hypothetical protein